MPGCCTATIVINANTTQENPMACCFAYCSLRKTVIATQYRAITTRPQLTSRRNEICKKYRLP